MGPSALPPDRSMRLVMQDRDNPKKQHEFTGWQSFNVIDDWWSGVPRFQAALAASPKWRDLVGPGGQEVDVYVDDDAHQFRGIIDERSEDTSLVSTDLEITGRGLAGQLIDCSIPPTYKGQNLWSLSNLSLKDVILQTGAPWLDNGTIPSVVTDNAANRYIVAGAARKVKKVPGVGYWDPQYLKINLLKWVDVEIPTGGRGRKAHGKRSPEYRGIDRSPIRQTNVDAGETPWGLWKRLAAQIGAHVWSGQDGTVICARPCYDMNPRQAYGEGIVLRWDKTNRRALGGNVRAAMLETTCAERFSEYYVYGQAKPNKKSRGKQMIRAGWTIKDPSPAFWNRQAEPPYLTVNKRYRPKLVDVKKLLDPKLIRRIAMMEMERAAIAGISLEYEMNGHRSPSGALWTTDSMVEVYDERNDIYGPHFIVYVDRRFQGIGDPPKGRTTLLKLIPPDVYLPAFDPDTISDDAYLQHMMHRIWW